MIGIRCENVDDFRVPQHHGGFVQLRGIQHGERIHDGFAFQHRQILADGDIRVALEKREVRIHARMLMREILCFLQKAFLQGVPALKPQLVSHADQGARGAISCSGDLFHRHVPDAFFLLQHEIHCRLFTG